MKEIAAPSDCLMYCIVQFNPISHGLICEEGHVWIYGLGPMDLSCELDRCCHVDLWTCHVDLSCGLVMLQILVTYRKQWWLQIFSTFSPTLQSGRNWLVIGCPQEFGCNKYRPETCIVVL